MAILTRPTGFTTDGPDLLVYGPYQSSDSVFFVDSVTGSDSNAGTEEKAPKATVFGASGAIASCTTSNSNLIVCFETHRETVSAYSWVKNGITIASRGSGTSVARFTPAGKITCSATEARIENLYFLAASAAITAKFDCSGVGFEARDCRFDIGTNDNNATNYDCIKVNAVAHATVKGCTFTVTATTSDLTRTGIRVTGASTNFLCEDTIFDGGSYGWSSGYALQIDTATADRFRLRSLILSNYSFAGASISGIKGYVGGNHSVDQTSGFRWAE